MGQCSKVLGSGSRQDASGKDDGNKGPCLFIKLEVLQLKIFLQVFFKFEVVHCVYSLYIVPCYPGTFFVCFEIGFLVV